MPGLGRAYAFIEIKSFEDDARIMRGVATTPSPDRLKDTVNPLGAKFELPIPFLWQHQHDMPVGHVIEAVPKATGIPFVAQLAKTDEPGTLKDQLDHAWQSLKLKLVRAVSIGFNPLKWSFLDNGGIDYEEWDWLELSGVTIPAQPEAVITTLKSITHASELDVIKALDAEARHAAGVPEFQIPSPPEPAATGKSARVVRLDDPAGVSAPFVIREIKRIPR